MYNVITCNNWLCNIKVKNSKACDYCDKTDDIAHVFKNCSKVNEFCSYWINWWEHLSGIAIQNSPILEECIIYGFLLNSDAIQVLHFCILYAKYYIYIQHLFHGNKLHLYACLTPLKFALEIE